VPFALIATVSAVFAHIMSRYNQRLLVEDILRLPAESPLRGITAELYECRAEGCRRGGARLTRCCLRMRSGSLDRAGLGSPTSTRSWPS